MNLGFGNLSLLSKKVETDQIYFRYDRDCFCDHKRTHIFLVYVLECRRNCVRR